MKPTYATVQGYKIDVGPNWHLYSPAQRQQICNGVGPVAWPREIVDGLNKLPYLKPAAYVHDVDFHAGGTEDERIAANKRFRKNAYRCAKQKLGGWVTRLFSGKARGEWLAAVLLVEAAYGLLVAGSSHFWNYHD